MKQKTNLQYIVLIVIMMAIAVTGVTLILIFRPESDNLAVISTIFGFLSTVTVSIMTFLKAQETHLSVNSRLDEFIKNSSLVAKAEGVAEGIEQANKRTDNLKKK